LLRRVELLGLLVVHNRTDDQRALLRGQRLVRERLDRAVDLDRRREIGRDEQVRAVALDHLAQKVLRESYCLIAFHCSPSDRLLGGVRQKFSLTVALKRASSFVMRPFVISSCRFWSSVCMPCAWPVWIAEYICATLPSRIRLRIAGVPIMISCAAMRPPPVRFSSV